MKYLKSITRKYLEKNEIYGHDMERASTWLKKLSAMKRNVGTEMYNKINECIKRHFGSNMRKYIKQRIHNIVTKQY